MRLLFADNSALVLDQGTVGRIRDHQVDDGYPIDPQIRNLDRSQACRMSRTCPCPSSSSSQNSNINPLSIGDPGCRDSR